MNPLSLIGGMFLLAALVLRLTASDDHAYWWREILTGAGLTVALWIALLTWAVLRYT